MYCINISITINSTGSVWAEPADLHVLDVLIAAYGSGVLACEGDGEREETRARRQWRLRIVFPGWAVEWQMVSSSTPGGKHTTPHTTHCVRQHTWSSAQAHNPAQQHLPALQCGECVWYMFRNCRIHPSIHFQYLLPLAFRLTHIQDTEKLSVRMRHTHHLEEKVRRSIQL